MTKFVSALMAVAVFAVTPASAQKKVSFGHQMVFDLAPVLIAQDKGFFAKHGLEVTFACTGTSVR